MEEERADRLTLTSAAGRSRVPPSSMGVVTPVDMRYYLAAIPAVAVTAALARAPPGRPGESPRRGRGLLGWALVQGSSGWWKSGDAIG